MEARLVGSTSLSVNPASQFYRFGTDSACIASIYHAEWEFLEGTHQQVKIPVGKQLLVDFHEQSRARRWPSIVSGDVGHNSIFLIASGLVNELRAAKFTGVEFYPVEMRFGNLKGLRGKEAECPTYLWARMTGLVYIDMFLGDIQVPLDASGRYPLEKRPLTQLWKMRIRSDQPECCDFSRVIPNATSHPVVSAEVAQFFRRKKFSELRIGAVGNGWL